MSEKTMRGNVIRALKPLDAFSVENKVNFGTPDVNYIGGWLELKWLRRWPKAAVVRIDHFTPQQRVFLKRRWRKGGKARLLLQVQREWLLFNGDDAATYVGRTSADFLRELAVLKFENGLRKEEFQKWLATN